MKDRISIPRKLGLSFISFVFILLLHVVIGGEDCQPGVLTTVQPNWLLLGDAVAARNATTLLKHNIRLVVTLAPSSEVPHVPISWRTPCPAYAGYDLARQYIPKNVEMEVYCVPLSHLPDAFRPYRQTRSVQLFHSNDITSEAKINSSEKPFNFPVTLADNTSPNVPVCHFVHLSIEDVGGPPVLEGLANALRMLILPWQIAIETESQDEVTTISEHQYQSVTSNQPNRPENAPMQLSTKLPLSHLPYSPSNPTDVRSNAMISLTSQPQLEDMNNPALATTLPTNSSSLVPSLTSLPLSWSLIGKTTTSRQESKSLMTAYTRNHLASFGLESSKVLVHCVKGQSRSPSLLMAWLMDPLGTRQEHMKTILQHLPSKPLRSRTQTLKSMFRLMKRRRPCVQPNYHWFQQLMDLELKIFPELQGTNTVTHAANYVPIELGPPAISEESIQSSNVSLSMIETTPKAVDAKFSQLYIYMVRLCVVLLLLLVMYVTYLLIFKLLSIRHKPKL